MNREIIVLVLGQGNIGRYITAWLSNKEYQPHTYTPPGVKPYKLKVHTADIDYHAVGHMNATFDHKINASTTDDWFVLIKEIKPQIVINALPHTENLKVLEAMGEYGKADYFDLTEDVLTSQMIRDCADRVDFCMVPHCGLAPGLINIIGADLIKNLETVESLELRVGALPRFTNNLLKYAINWSADGLINEYLKDAESLIMGHKINVPAMYDLEKIVIDGTQYEAFTTSGGLGTMTSTYERKINKLNYKTIRYPGHCEIAQSLRFSKEDFIKRCPPSAHDVVVLFAQAVGTYKGEVTTKTFVGKWFGMRDYSSDCYPHGLAIQYTTALSCCAVVDLMVLSKINGWDRFKPGLVKQEDISLYDFANISSFGKKIMDANRVEAIT